MAETTNISIRMEKDLKRQAEELFSNFGLSLSTAFNLFVRQSVREQKIPFAIAMVTSNMPSHLELHARGLVAIRRLREESEKNGTDKMSMEEIDALVQAARAERKA